MDQLRVCTIAQAQLAIDLNCTMDDLNGEKDSFVFVNARNNTGRRPFPRSEHCFEMLSMGNAIVVSATPTILNIAKHLLIGKGRDEAFSMPFVYGHSLYYLPDLKRLSEIPAPGGFTYELIERNGIPQLYQTEGFHNAISYDIGHLRPDVLAVVAKADDRIAGMAGVSDDCAKMWQIGIDVLPEYRGNGLAAYLVSVLTKETLKRGCVPYYGTASSNIPSQRAAHRVGFYPAWICCYHGKFDGYDILPTS